MRIEIDWDPQKARANLQKHDVSFDEAMSVFSATMDRDEMKDEYDFSKATRGKFYRKDAVLVPPIHLETNVLRVLQDRAKTQGTTLDKLVNELLKRDIERIDAVK